MSILGLILCCVFGFILGVNIEANRKRTYSRWHVAIGIMFIGVMLCFIMEQLYQAGLITGSILAGFYLTQQLPNGSWAVASKIDIPSEPGDLKPSHRRRRRGAGRRQSSSDDHVFADGGSVDSVDCGDGVAATSADCD